MAQRIHHIDWLRVLAVLLLFPFHTTRLFDTADPFYVKADVVTPWLSYFLAFVDKWHMPLLFLLAGASTCLALGKRTPGQYAGERVKRLLVPFLFGLLVLIPPQTWYGGRTNSGYAKPFWTYLVSGDFLAFNIRDGGDYFGGFGLGHLWFVVYLFLISLVMLPMIAWSKRERGGRGMAKWAARLANPVWWLPVAIVLWVTEGLPDPTGLGFFYYLTWFALGFIVMHAPAFAETSERWRWPATGMGVAACVAYSAAGPWRDSLPDPSWTLTLVNVAGMLGAWLVVVGMVGLSKRHLDRPSPALAYLGEASYPVYILHQTVIVVAGYYVVRLAVGWPLQWALVLAAAVAGTFVLYEVVRRVAPLRALFGMRPVEPAKPEVAPATA